MGVCCLELSTDLQNILRAEIWGGGGGGGELPTYSFPKLTLTLTSHLGQNDGLGEG